MCCRRPNSAASHSKSSLSPRWTYFGGHTVSRGDGARASKRPRPRCFGSDRWSSKTRGTPAWPSTRQQTRPAVLGGAGRHQVARSERSAGRPQTQEAPPSCSQALLGRDGGHRLFARGMLPAMRGATESRRRRRLLIREMQPARGIPSEAHLATLRALHQEPERASSFEQKALLAIGSRQLGRSDQGHMARAAKDTVPGAGMHELIRSKALQHLEAASLEAGGMDDRRTKSDRSTNQIVGIRPIGREIRESCSGDSTAEFDTDLQISRTCSRELS